MNAQLWFGYCELCLWAFSFPYFCVCSLPAYSVAALPSFFPCSLVALPPPPIYNFYPPALPILSQHWALVASFGFVVFKLYLGCARPGNVSLFPSWPKVRELALTSSSFKEVLLSQTKVPPRLWKGVLLFQGYCQQVRLIASPHTPGIKK